MTMQTPIITLDTSQSATILAAVITALAAWIAPNLIRRLFNNVKKKTDTGEQRKVLFDWIEHLQKDKEKLEADKLELEQSNAAAQVQIDNLRSKLKDCGCE